ERVIAVPAMSVPAAATSLTVEAAGHCHAVALFVSRASLSCPSFSVTEEDIASVAELCRRLGGIPLALILVAAQLRSLSVDQALAQLVNQNSFMHDSEEMPP